MIERYHLPALMASTAVHVAACVDSELARAQMTARRVGAALACSSHRDLPGNVDAAIVAVPNEDHADVAAELLRAGVHVLVEKPMAVDVVECDRMMAAASSTGTVLAVGHDFRHFPIATFARHLFAAGALGPVRAVDVRQTAGTRWPACSPRALMPAAGGGVLLSFGIHLLDLMSWWFGDLHPVRYSDDAAGGVEADCSCDCVLSNGAPVHLELSRRRKLRDTFVVRCERGTIELGLYEPAIVHLTLPSGGCRLAGFVPDAAFTRAPMQTVFRRQLSDFIDAIHEQRKPLVGATEGRRAVELVQACYRLRRSLRQPWDFPEAYGVPATASRSHAG